MVLAALFNNILKICKQSFCKFDVVRVRGEDNHMCVCGIAPFVRTSESNNNLELMFMGFNTHISSVELLSLTD